MEKRLRGVKLCKNTLRVNLARFAKEIGSIEPGVLHSGNVHSENKRMADSVNQVKKDGFTRPGCSYSMALKDDMVVKYEAGEIRVKAGVIALASRHEKDVLVRSRDFSPLINIKNLLSKDGYADVGVQVWVSEDLGDWIPDCLEADYDSEDSEDGVLESGSEKMSSELPSDLVGGRKVGETGSFGQEGASQEFEETIAAHEEIIPNEINDGAVPMHEGLLYQGGGTFKKVGEETHEVNMVKTAGNSQEGFIIGVEKHEAPPQGFFVGTGENKRTGFRRPMILAQNRKYKAQLVSPTDNRPNKRLRQIMDESFNFTVPMANAAPS
ncbi:hypothetical protein Hanom_Chr15g01398431 [Helianthus anomalus]